MKHGLTFTIYHGLIASLAIHAAIASPFVLRGWMQPPDEPESLVLELQGVNATTQSEEKVVQETKGEETQDRKEAMKPQDTPPPQPPTEQKEVPVEQQAEREAPAEAVTTAAQQQPVEAKSGQPGANNVVGATERQQAQTIQRPVTEAQLIQAYVKLLSKKVHANLVYPDDARDAQLEGVPVVSCTILADGRLRPETLKIRTSSGKPKLDAAALKTVAASAPFDPPPREMTIAIDVRYGDLSAKPKAKN